MKNGQTTEKCPGGGRVHFQNITHTVKSPLFLILVIMPESFKCCMLHYTFSKYNHDKLHSILTNMQLTTNKVVGHKINVFSLTLKENSHS